MRVILLGPPGAGKGTQAERISRALGLTHLASGDILRAERTRGTEFGRRVAGYMDAGKLVPDGLMIEAILLRLPACEVGALLDGFPRTVAQAESLDEAIDRAGQRIDGVVELQVADDVVLERITGRRICPECNSVYHVRFKAPAQADCCDADGAALKHRSDDQPNVVKRRLQEYYEKSKPLVGYYGAKGLVTQVDAGGSVDTVTRDVLRAVRGVSLRGAGTSG